MFFLTGVVLTDSKRKLGQSPMHTVSFIFKFSGLKILVKWNWCEIGVSELFFIFLVMVKNKPFWDWFENGDQLEFMRPKVMTLVEQYFIFQRPRFLKKNAIFNAWLFPFADICCLDFHIFKPFEYPLWSDFNTRAAFLHQVV